MKKFFLTILSCYISIFVFGQLALEGLYVGIEEMCWIDSTGKKDCYLDFEKPNWTWYHLSYLKIKKDSVFLDQSPISVFNSDTLYSASDGGFFYYTGTFRRVDSILKMDLKELFCDYCGIPHEKDSNGKWVISIRKQTYSAQLVENGFLINGYLFKKTTRNYRLRSESPAPAFWK